MQEEFMSRWLDLIVSEIEFNLWLPRALNIWHSFLFYGTKKVYYLCHNHKTH